MSSCLFVTLNTISERHLPSGVYEEGGQKAVVVKTETPSEWFSNIPSEEFDAYIVYPGWNPIEVEQISRFIRSLPPGKSSVLLLPSEEEREWFLRQCDIDNCNVCTPEDYPLLDLQNIFNGLLANNPIQGLMEEYCA